MIPVDIIYNLRMWKYYHFPPKIPSNVFIEVTNRCAYACKMCPRVTMTRDLGDMSPFVFEKVINQMVDAGIKNANLYLYGESMLNKNILSMIQYAKSKDRYLILETTGYNLTPISSKLLIESELDEIFFSVHGPTRETYMAAHGVDKFEKVVENIKDFIQLKKEIGGNTPRICVQSALMETNKDVYYDIKGVFGNDVYYSLTNCTYNPHVNLHDLRMNKTEYTRKLPCTEAYNQLAVSWDGKITACCNDMNFSLNLGNIYDTTLKDAFNSVDMLMLRSMMREGKIFPKICQGCVDAITYAKNS
jgi:radical SAM protein with 4Fe4S-binding SPASM domain